MKFTRSLALATVAAFAMSMTACDDDTNPVVAPEAKLVKTTYTLGTQDQSDLPSVLSIRNNGTIKVADLTTADKNSENIDIIFFEKTNNTSNVGVFFSPKALVADPTYGTGTTVAKMTAAAKLIDTKFAYLDVEEGEVTTAGELAEAFADVSSGAWVSALDITKKGVVGVKTATMNAIVEVSAPSVVPAAGGDKSAVNLNILVAK